MSKVEEVESTVVAALNSAIADNYMLISGNFGVRWDFSTEKWISEDESGTSKTCDLFGALVLANPSLPSDTHRGSIHRAVRMLVDPEVDLSYVESSMDSLLASESYKVAHSLMAGWDNEADIFGHPEAFRLGAKLREAYRPLSAEILALADTGRKFVPVSAQVVVSPEEDLFSEDDVESLTLTELEVNTG